MQGFHSFNTNIVPITSFKLDKKKGMIFTWHTDKGYTDFPFAISLQLLVASINDYLRTECAENIRKNLFHKFGDGSMEYGWRVFVPSCDHTNPDCVGCNNYTPFCVCPATIFYSK